MAGNNENDLLITDLCGTGRATKVDKQVDLQTPLTGSGTEPTAIASLGCSPVLSHRVTDGAALSRVLHKNGSYRGLLLASSDGTDRGQPGPATHIDVVKADLMAGSVPNPFPLSDAGITLDWFLGADHWWHETMGGASLFGSLLSFSNPRGFGSAYGPYAALRLPPSRTFDGRGKRFVNHFYDNLLLMPKVSTLLEPLMLHYNSGTGLYRWFGNSSVEGNNVFSVVSSSNIISGVFYTVFIAIKECFPAIFGSCSGEPVSGTLMNDGAQNGPDLNRNYCYIPFATNYQVPDYGDTDSQTYVLDSLELRPQLIMYSPSQPDPASFTIEFNTVVGSGPTGVSLPASQIMPNGFILNGIPDMTQAHTFATPTSLNLFDITINIPGGFQILINSGTTTPTPQYSPNNCPRYYEGIMGFTKTVTP